MTEEARVEQIYEIFTANNHDAGTVDRLLKKFPDLDPDEFSILFGVSKGLMKTLDDEPGGDKWQEDNLDYRNVSASYSARFSNGLIAKVKIEVGTKMTKATTEPLSELIEVDRGIPWPGQREDCYPDNRKLFDIDHVSLVGNRIAKYYFGKDLNSCSDDELEEVIKRLKLETESVHMFLSTEVEKRLAEYKEHQESQERWTAKKPYITYSNEV